MGKNKEVSLVNQPRRCNVKKTEANKRLKSSICQKILGLFLAEKEFLANMTARMEKLRHELEKEFGELPQGEKIKFLKEEINSYSDDEFGAILGVTPNAIRGYRSKAGVQRNLNGRLTSEQRELVEKTPREEIGVLAKQIGCHEHYLLAIKKASERLAV